MRKALNVLKMMLVLMSVEVWMCLGEVEFLTSLFNIKLRGSQKNGGEVLVLILMSRAQLRIKADET